MNKRIYYYFASIICLFIMSSCDNEDMKFEPVEFEHTGLTLTKGENVCKFYGTIPCDEKEITFVAIGENAEAGFLSGFSDGKHGHDFGKQINDYDNPEPTITLSGEWGYIEFVTSEPYTTKFVFSENTSSTPRQFTLSFGCCYTMADIIITQQGKDATTK